MSLLFSPLNVKGFTFRNRVVMPPMVAGLGDAEGRVTDAVLEHYAARARAGTGLIIVEATAVDAGGRCWAGGLGAYDDEHLEGLRRLAERIHGEGALASIQLVHGGPQASPEVMGRETVGPSAVKPSDDASVPRALTVDEILAIEQRFEDAAARVLQAGFDGVEVHGAHGYLLDSFLSSRRNQRTDAYGGSLAGRARMMVETCARVRRRIGERALLDCRVSFFNKRDEGFTAAGLAELVALLEQTGVDILHVSTDGAFRGYFGTEKTIGHWVKESTRLPIIVAGGLGNPPDAERALVEGHADLAAIGKPMFDDADWTARARVALG